MYHARHAYDPLLASGAWLHDGRDRSEAVDESTRAAKLLSVYLLVENNASTRCGENHIRERGSE